MIKAWGDASVTALMYAADMSMVTASSLATRSGAELVEERPERRGVLALLGPDDPLRVVVDDHRDVLVVAAVGQLVDTDVHEPLEQVAPLVAADDPLDDVADGRPRDAHQLLDGRLVAALSEVSDVVLERPREPRPDVGPGQVLDDDAAPRTVDPARVVLQVPLHACQVEVPPAAPLDGVVPGAVLTAARAPRRPPGRADFDHEAIVDERATPHASVFQPEQVGE
jgi:hypothetical protein